MPGPFDRITGAIGSALGRGGSEESRDEPDQEQEEWTDSEREESAEPESSSEPQSSAEPDEPDEPESSPEPDEPAEPKQPASAETAEQSSDRPQHASIRQDEGLPTAPSIGPHTHIEHVPPEERLAGHEYSDVDAMGLEKRRSVVGGSYSPTRTRIIATFATFFAVVAVLAVGFFLLAKELDQPPESNTDEAPWSAPDAPQNAVPKLQ